MSTKYDWRWENSISTSKQRVESDEFPYVSWRTNSYFANFIDTVFYANMMNTYYDLDPKLQYDFMMASVPKKKRFFRRATGVNHDDFTLIQDVYKYNVRRTREALDVLTKDQLATLKNKIEKGGVS